MPIQTFSFTGSEQTFSVPSNVGEIEMELYGAGGGRANGAAGGFVEGVLSVTGGETLYVYVGGQGGTPSGGFNGGGDGGNQTNTTGGGGGGASDTRQGGNTTADQVAVAAGGGGGGHAIAYDATDETGGGLGGAATGEDAADASASQDATTADGQGGDGGTQSAGGNGGGGGARLTGGTGDDTTQVDATSSSASGGGGGGGYYGGAGGGADAFGAPDVSAAGGGGGGSNYTGGLATVTASTRGAGNSADGQVIFAYVATPQNVSVTGHDATSITLSWDSVTGADEYRVYQATASGSTFGDYTQVGTTGTVGFTDTGLLNGEEYFYRVTAADTSESVESTLSAEVSQVTDLPAPTNLTHPSVDATSSDYSWTANANNGSIRVEYKDAAAGSWTTFSTVSNTTEAETVTGLLNGNLYDSRVVAETEHTETVDT